MAAVSLDNGRRIMDNNSRRGAEFSLPHGCLVAGTAWECHWKAVRVLEGGKIMRLDAFVHGCIL